MIYFLFWMYLHLRFSSYLLEDPLTQCSTNNPFKKTDSTCTNFENVCIKNDDVECKLFKAACQQCPPSNITVTLLQEIIKNDKILSEQINRTDQNSQNQCKIMTQDFKEQMKNTSSEIRDESKIIQDLKDQMKSMNFEIRNESKIIKDLKDQVKSMNFEIRNENKIIKDLKDQVKSMNFEIRNESNIIKEKVSYYMKVNNYPSKLSIAILIFVLMGIIGGILMYLFTEDRYKQIKKRKRNSKKTNDEILLSQVVESGSSAPNSNVAPNMSGNVPLQSSNSLNISNPVHTELNVLLKTDNNQPPETELMRKDAEIIRIKKNKIQQCKTKISELEAENTKLKSEVNETSRRNSQLEAEVKNWRDKCEKKINNIETVLKGKPIPTIESVNEIKLAISTSKVEATELGNDLKQMMSNLETVLKEKLISSSIESGIPSSESSSKNPPATTAHEETDPLRPVPVTAGDLQKQFDELKNQYLKTTFEEFDRKSEKLLKQQNEI